jgi:hypothetical protein
MFNAKPLLVLGAGASAELKFPTGNQLCTALAATLDFRPNEFDKIEGDRDLLRAIERHAPTRGLTRNDYVKACMDIRDGVFLAKSIDDFLDIHSTNDGINFVGKMAIANSILDYEKIVLFVSIHQIYTIK